MSARNPIAPLPFAPDAYDPKYINELIRTLNWYFRQLQNPGPIYGTTLNVTQLPTDATGLPIGAVWVDTDNILKMVTSVGVQALTGVSTAAQTGTVTV